MDWNRIKIKWKSDVALLYNIANRIVECRIMELGYQHRYSNVEMIKYVCTNIDSARNYLYFLSLKCI